MLFRSGDDGAGAGGGDLVHAPRPLWPQLPHGLRNLLRVLDRLNSPANVEQIRHLSLRVYAVAGAAAEIAGAVSGTVDT